MTTLTLFLFLIEVFQCVRAAELQWSSHVQHGRNFSCPGELVVFTCTVNNASHYWNISSETNASDSFTVLITPQNLLSQNRSFSFAGFVNGSAIITNATVIGTPSIGTTNVICQDSPNNTRINVQSVQATFIDASSWTLSVNTPSSEHPLSDLSVNISIAPQRARQCVDSFIITNLSTPSLRCIGNRNATTIYCPPQNFCQQRMYSLNGSTTTAFSASSVLVNYNPQIPKVLFPGTPSVSYMYGVNGLVAVVVTWQVIDDVVMNRNTVAVNASLSVSGQRNNGVFLNDTSKRFTFNISHLIDAQQDNLTLNASLEFMNGSCFERISEIFQVPPPAITPGTVLTTPPTQTPSPSGAGVTVGIIIIMLVFIVTVVIVVIIVIIIRKKPAIKKSKKSSVTSSGDNDEVNTANQALNHHTSYEESENLDTHAYTEVPESPREYEIPQGGVPTTNGVPALDYETPINGVSLDYEVPLVPTLDYEVPTDGVPTLDYEVPLDGIRTQKYEGAQDQPLEDYEVITDRVRPREYEVPIEERFKLTPCPAYLPIQQQKTDQI